MMINTAFVWNVKLWHDNCSCELSPLVWVFFAAEVDRQFSASTAKNSDWLLVSVHLWQNFWMGEGKPIILWLKSISESLGISNIQEDNSNVSTPHSKKSDRQLTRLDMNWGLRSLADSTALYKSTSCSSFSLDKAFKVQIPSPHILAPFL